MLKLFLFIKFQTFNFKGTEYAIKSHLVHILNLIKSGFEHQSWKIRIQAASSLSTIFNKLQSKIEPVYVDEILDILNTAATQRIWSGKVPKIYFKKKLLKINLIFIRKKF